MDQRAKSVEEGQKAARAGSPQVGEPSAGQPVPDPATEQLGQKTPPPSGQPSGQPAGEKPQAQPGAPTPAGDADAQFSDDELAEFVEVAPKVGALEQQFGKQLQGASSADEAKKIQANAREKIEEVFATTELEPRQYSMIAKKMSTQPEFRKRVQQVASTN